MLDITFLLNVKKRTKRKRISAVTAKVVNILPYMDSPSVLFIVDITEVFLQMTVGLLG